MSDVYSARTASEEASTDREQRNVEWLADRLCNDRQLLEAFIRNARDDYDAVCIEGGYSTLCGMQKMVEAAELRAGR